MDVVDINNLEEFSTIEVVKKVPMLTDRAVVSLLFFEKEQEMSLHKHENCDEIIYIIDGECEITVGNETKKLKSKNMVLVPMLVLHGIKNCSNKRLTIMTFTSIECKQKEI